MGMKSGIMKKGADLWTGLFLMILSGLVIRESFDLEIGTPHNPGSGFMYLGTALVLEVLALQQVIKALLSQGEEGFDKVPEQAPAKTHPWRIVAVVLANIFYIVLLEKIGFLICTFVLMCFLLQINERGKWVWAIGGAALASFVSYVVFSRLLQLNLPKGVIPF